MEPARLVRAAFHAHPQLSAPGVRHVVAAGKAARPMLAAAAELTAIRAALLTGTVPGPGRTGPEGGTRPLETIPDLAAFEAGHPAPNQASVAAGERALVLASASAAAAGGDLLVLLSGGASAMLVAPAPGVSLADKLATAKQLMERGAPIDELNCVRKHLSRIKGGRLGAAAGRCVTLALSDVHGPVADDPSVIGSGPTVADASTFGDALDILRRRNVDAPAGARAHLERGARGEVEETIKPADPRLRNSAYFVIGNRLTAMDGARRAARARGYHVIVLPAPTSGEARHAGARFVAEALRAAGGAPLCVIGSGETTVAVHGAGTGGRNQEFALGAALALDELARGAAATAGARPRVAVASAGTDGIDGPTDAAGAIADTTTMARGRRRGLDAQSFLSRNDTYNYFGPLEDLVRWGPTGTNVGDVHVALISEPGTGDVGSWDATH